MTNYNERRDEIFYQYGRKVAESAADDWKKHEALTEFTKVDMTNHYTEAKQALTSLFKEMVADAKPGTWVDPKDTDDLKWQGYVDGVNDFEQNLLKALEEVNR